jgi:hypothetical protein
MSFAERHRGGQGKELIIIRGASRNTGFVRPTGAEETVQSGVTVKAEQVGRVAVGMHNGSFPARAVFSTRIIPHGRISVKS